MERILFDRTGKLLVTCPHFRGLDIYIDSVEGFEIYSAPYIFGILPRDWDRIRNETSLFDSAGHISRTRWQKIVNLTTESKSTNMRNKIIIATGKTNYKGNQNRTFNLAFSDTAAYPIPTTNFAINFREFRFECSHMFTLEFPYENNNSNSIINNNNNNNSNNNNNNNNNNKKKKKKNFMKF